MYIAAGQGQTTLGEIFWCQQKSNVASAICYKFQKISLKSDFIFFFFFSWFYTCICLGADNPLGMKLLWQQEYLVILVICCKFQKNLFEFWFSTNVFMILYMYIALGQGQTAPRGQRFDVNRNVLSLHQFVASLKKNVFEVWFYTFFFMI